jgi:phosphonate transport system permease protein
MTSTDLTRGTPPAHGRLLTLRNGRIAVVVAVVIAVYVHAWGNTQVSIGEFFSSFHNLVTLVKEMFPPDWSILHECFNAAVLTFDVALLGTTAGVIVSLVLAPLAARNLTPHRSVFEATRFVIGFARTIPLLVSGLLFLVVVGLTPYAGVLALTVETIGVLPKLYAEAIEEMDMGPVDALRVAGARRSQVFLHGVLPSVTPTFVGLALYRMDSNVRSALFLSAIGAGGMGFLMYQSIQLFQWPQLTTELIVLFGLILIVERASILIRARIK